MEKNSATTDYLTHLRLPFQFLLSPIFLWGYLLASGKPTWQLGIAYLSFHLFLYGGGTALNSVYDRDEGPIGGLAAPPPVPPHLLAFSLIWQGIGFLLALTINLVFSAIYAVMFCLSIAYSYPRIRWKGRPFLGLATIALGQGILPFLAGWVTARSDIQSAFNLQAALGLVAATLLTTGFYPLTQIYQLEEDARRGDFTFARFLGIPGSFQFASGCIVLGGGAALVIALIRFSMAETGLLLLFMGALLLLIWQWRRRFERQSVLENFGTLMRLYAGLTLPFLGWIVFHLFIH